MSQTARPSTGSGVPPHQRNASDGRSHRRQHSQGYFEPSLLHTPAAGLTASQSAAQAAMHRLSPPPPPSAPPPAERKRSYTGLAPLNTTAQSSEVQSPQSLSAGAVVAASAASAAFPGKKPPPSPGPKPTTSTTAAPPEKGPRPQRSRMKLFKPKNISLGKEKDAGGGIPSPNKSASLLRAGLTVPAAVPSPIDITPGPLSANDNSSTATLVPPVAEKEKKHHFLSRQKLKHKDEPLHLPLSSAHSNSQPTNPDKPAPLYSFTPDSPGPGSFSKTMSGFDLRHGAKALRDRKSEKRKEEKAAAAAKLDLTPIVSHTSATGGDLNLGSYYSDSVTPLPSSSSNIFPSDAVPSASAQTFSNIGAQMGLPGMGPDDAWPLLKARLLKLFQSEDLRTPIEDFNMLVSVHIRRCIQRKAPLLLVEDVRELLQTGFMQLAHQSLRGVPDDRLVTRLVGLWTGVYGTIMPFLQAVFLPLDLEFKGLGTILTDREAKEFWRSVPEYLKNEDRPASSSSSTSKPTVSDDFDIRHIALVSFRDSVILPKHENLMSIFSRLSLENFHTTSSTDKPHKPSTHDRPGTADSLSPHLASFNSQASTLLDAASSSSGGPSLASRSRATSNTSAGSFGTGTHHLSSPNPPLGALTETAEPPAFFADPAKITETAALMLQCLYVLASCHTGDAGQSVIERLTQALKYNWLGRQRTGGDRRGFVEMRPFPKV
ncbi:HbrB-like protein [Piedraia hortae CBS 480.64]|uniref:HbrB-like protein n=1 Tax=Piedraia hortae CBS 480.64 TaxID=1314780 RepID=A0A6A7C554_9PEZI|nr:HbrB-like protein [Piedraia hortae CBS 480.64]